MFTTYMPKMTASALLLISLPVHFFISHDHSVMIAALLVAAIGGAYIGFGAADDRVPVFWFESTMAFVFVFAGFLAIVWTPLMVPIALVGHALWDFLHHNGSRFKIGTEVPQWYIPMCLIYDLGAAAFFFWFFWPVTPV